MNPEFPDCCDYTLTVNSLLSYTVTNIEALLFTLSIKAK